MEKLFGLWNSLDLPWGWGWGALMLSGRSSWDGNLITYCAAWGCLGQGGGYINAFSLVHCSASGGSFWDRPPGCACLFWIQSGRGLDCSTSMPRGGLDLSQQSLNRRKVGLWNSQVGGRRYVTLAKWVTEVGHWPPSSLGNFSVIKETYFCDVNCVALLQCELLFRQLH